MERERAPDLDSHDVGPQGLWIIKRLMDECKREINEYTCDRTRLVSPKAVTDAKRVLRVYPGLGSGIDEPIKIFEDWKEQFPNRKS